jgi:prophage maintenance system killer protein
LLNGHDLRYDVDDAEAFVLSIAAGRREVAAIAEWTAAHLTDASHSA